MPNICNNRLAVSGDREQLRKFINAIIKEPETGSLSIAQLFPMPENETDWYNWCVRNWGTKWGDYNHAHEIRSLDIEPTINNYASFTYETAWAPFKETFWHKVSTMFPDLEFLIIYEEPGLCYAGSEKFMNGETIYSEYIDNTNEILPDVDFDDTESWEKYEDAKTELLDQLLENAQAA